MKEQYKMVNKYLSVLESLRWRDIKKAENMAICPCGYKSGHTPPPKGEFIPFENGEEWGSGKDSHAWFYFQAPAFEGELFLHADTDRDGWNVDNPQFILYVNGEMRQGLDTNHREARLTQEDSKGEIYLYAYTGAKTHSARFFADFRRLDSDIDRLYYDILYPLQLINCLSENSAEYAHILFFLYKSVSLLRLYDLDSEDFRSSVARAREYLDREFYSGYCHSSPTKTVCIGHTHIDCAWLWTLKQTREKVQRSFSTVLELMRRYPEYKFMSSQAFLYKNLKEEAPEVYREVAERIKEGRWECEGAMWVEADCNLTSGESLVRQILYGKRFFVKEFGVDNRVLWLPDVFGYSAALPQILKKSGVDWFVTSKISWNELNRMPYDTFLWKGIDGTAVNSYFLTARSAGASNKNRATYNSSVTADYILGTYEEYKQKELSREALLTFGYGDGGGGPTAEQLELLRRGAKGLPSSPQAKIEFAGDFLSRLESNMKSSAQVPIWEGELYLEYHRGTYTTMAKNKRNNRMCEFLYLDAELLGVMARELFGDSFPKEELHRGWEMILTNQFHDIIPGSSIEEVYDQCDIDYAEIEKTGRSITDSVRERVAASLCEDSGYAVFNPHSFVGEGFVRVEGRSAYVKDIAPKGYSVTSDLSFDNHISTDMKNRTIESDTVRLSFDSCWQLSSVYDKKANREALSQGEAGNQLRVYADYPEKYDAWEWKEYSTYQYRTVTELSAVTPLEDGARAGVRITRPYGSSTIVQDIYINDHNSLIEFETYVDWHESHQMLKAAFPTDIHTQRATYEIQFGTVERPTHKNTDWDRAKFEVCGHKYADLSESGYGVSLINNCKYGHDIHDGVMMLSLLRSPTYPNPNADRGEHRFTYALYPHVGSLEQSDTPRLAYYLNYPMTALKTKGRTDLIPKSYSVIKLEGCPVICETVKEEEDGEGIILRLYEHRNSRGYVSLTLPKTVKKAFLCDMTERELEELTVRDGKVGIYVKNFEIVTLKLK